MIQKFTQLAIAAAVIVSVLICPVISRGQVFSNTSPITVNSSGPSTPSPSTITVSGGPSSISFVSVRLIGFSHTWSDDVDILLVAPNGDALTLISDCGSPFGTFWSSQTFEISDNASVGMSDQSGSPSGTYKPTDFTPAETFTGFVGIVNRAAPSGSSTLSSVFGGNDANGTWSLYVQDDTAGDGGSISGGWELNFSSPGCTDPAAANYDPTAAVDDGSCVYCDPGEQALFVKMTDSYPDGWNFNYYLIVDENDQVIAQGSLDNAQYGDGQASGYDQYCLAPGCYFISVLGGSYPDEVGWSLEDGIGNVILTGEPGQGAPVENLGFAWAGQEGCVIPGCTNPDCNNYNPGATEDDGSCICPAENDDCATATPISCGQSLQGSLLTANYETGLAPPCSGVSIDSPGVWYTFQGTGDQVTLSTCASSPDQEIRDTKIHVYSGDCSNPQCVASNDDNAGCDFNTSAVTFTSEVGVTYYVLVTEWAFPPFVLPEGIDFVLDMTCVSCEVPITNDDCATAITLTSGTPAIGSLCCSNPDAELAGTGNGVWYTFNSGDYETMEVFIVNGDAPNPDANDGTNVGLDIYESLLGGCPDNNFYAGCQPVTDECGGNLLELGFPITPNTDYYFLVYTSDPANCGGYTLTVTGLDLGCTDVNADNYDPNATYDDGTCIYTTVPDNDLCENAEPLTCNSTVEGSTGGATNTGAPVDCDIASDDAGVWYSVVGDGQIFTVSTCGSAIDSRVEVYAAEGGCEGTLTCVDSEDDDPSEDGCGFFEANDASVSFISEVGTTYFIYITAGAADTNGDEVDDLFDGTFELSLDCAPVVAGCQDECACNYNPNANVDDESCDYFSCAGCGNNESGFAMVMYDDFGDGWNGGSYTIYDLDGQMIATGSLDDGGCVVDENGQAGPDEGFDIICLPDACYTIEVGGGEWDSEISWELLDAQGAVVANGLTGEESFVTGTAVCGCTDQGACNYDPAATDDDGSCEYLTCTGCTDQTACNFDPQALILDPEACCYDNCIVLNMTDSGSDGWNGSVAVITDLSTGEVVGTTTLASAGSGSETFCLVDGCYEIAVSTGNAPVEVSWVLGGANEPASGGAGSSQSFVVGTGNCTPGCLEPFACNYDPNAGLSDCTLCEYVSCQGCTYPQASNYDPNAIIDDGSCLIDESNPCPSDINEDGIVNVLDLIIFIADYGMICE